MRLRRWWSLVPAYPFLLFVLSVTAQRLAAQAQASTGLIRGVVSDSTNGAPIVGANVTLRNVETNDIRTLTTNSSGTYVGPLLRVGTYDVSARAVGYTPADRKGVLVRLGEPATVDLALRPQAVQLQEITAEGVRAITEPDRVAAETRLDAQVVSGLPNNGRNFLNLTLLTPNVGVVQGPDGDELSVGGQRGIHNNVSVDGADFNNPFFGEQRGGQRPPFTFNLDAVQEIVVVSQGANAEFGRSGGGFVNVITKSGTNQLHGSAALLRKIRPALERFLPHLPDRRDDRLRPDFTQHQFGFTLGGPIERDRAFFFLALRPAGVSTRSSRRIGSGSSTPRWSPSSTPRSAARWRDFGPIRRTNDATAVLAKFDFRLSAEAQRLAQVQLHLLAPGERHLRRGPLGTELQRRGARLSHAINGSLSSLLSSALQRIALPVRAGRPSARLRRADNPATGRPLPRYRHASRRAPGFRFGLPFFLPAPVRSTRGSSCSTTSHSCGGTIFQGRRGVEPDAGKPDLHRLRQRTNDLQLGAGFINYVRFGNGYVECSDGSSSTTGACPPAPRSPGRSTRICSSPGWAASRRSRRGPRRSPSTSSRSFFRTPGSRAAT